MGIHNIISILNNLTVAHETLLASGEQKRQAIIQDNVEEVTRIVQQESKLLKQIAELDKQRMLEVGSYLRTAGIRPTAASTISDLIKSTTKIDEKQQLRESQERLLVIIDQVKKVNELNQQLIEHSLAFINYTLDVLTGPAEDSVIYQRPTSQGYALKRQGMFDTKA